MANLEAEEIVLFEDETAATAEVVIELDETDSSATSQASKYKDLEWPCLVVSGVLVQQEMNMLQERSKEPEISVPLYVEFNGNFTKVGMFDMTLDNLLIMRRMGYKQILILPDGTERELDDPSNYLNFMRL